MKTVVVVSFLFLISMFVGACGGKEGKLHAEREVAEFHRKLDRGDFKGIYAASHPDFKTATSEKEFVELLDAIHRKLGSVTTAEQLNWRVNSFNFKTTVALAYKTHFALGDGVESFNYMIDGKNATLLGYNINSHALITK